MHERLNLVEMIPKNRQKHIKNKNKTIFLNE